MGSDVTKASVTVSKRLRKKQEVNTPGESKMC